MSEKNVNVEKFKDVLMHTKSKDPEDGLTDKMLFTTTRWEDVLGAPHIVDSVTLDTTNAAEWMLYKQSEIYLTEAEFNKIFNIS